MPWKKIIFAAFFFLSICLSGCNVRLQKTGSEMTVEVGIARSNDMAEVIPINVDGNAAALILRKGPNHGTYQVWRWSNTDGGQNCRYSIQPQSVWELRPSGHQTNEPEHGKAVASSGNYRDSERHLAIDPDRCPTDCVGGLREQCPDGQPTGRSPELLGLQSFLPEQCREIGRWLDGDC